MKEQLNPTLIASGYVPASPHQHVGMNRHPRRHCAMSEGTPRVCRSRRPICTRVSQSACTSLFRIRDRRGVQILRKGSCDIQFGLPLAKYRMCRLQLSRTALATDTANSICNGDAAVVRVHDNLVRSRLSLADKIMIQHRRHSRDDVRFDHGETEMFGRTTKKYPMFYIQNDRMGICTCKT